MVSDVYVIQLIDEYLSLLTALGLSVVQARVYVSLLEIGDTSVEDISQQTKICQSDVECALCELQKIGLIREISLNPIS
jgi:sugar-specific transcriptional regulator TrmB